MSTRVKSSINKRTIDLVSFLLAGREALQANRADKSLADKSNTGKPKSSVYRGNK